MKKSKEEVTERRERVLETLLQEGVVKVEVLAEMLDVSPLTVRRDLQYLEDQNKLERFYGGAVIANGDMNVQDELITYKNSIARYAASLVEDGDSIFINTSSTAIQMLRYIQAKNVTVITNNGQAVNLEHSADVAVVLTGGELRGSKEAMVGEFAINNVSKVLAKKSFLGCSGLSAECGMTTENLSEVNVNELMCSRVTDQVYVLADHTKLGQDSSFVSCELAKIGTVITDDKADAEFVAQLKEQGINVVAVAKTGVQLG